MTKRLSTKRFSRKTSVSFINPFVANAPFRYILKTSENHKAYFRRHAEAKRAEIISAWFGSAWHASVLDEENIAVLKQSYW